MAVNYLSFITWCRKSSLNNVVSVAFLTLLLLFVSQTAQAGVNQWSAIGPNGGYIRALAIDPATPSTIYAGTEYGGVFKSIDSGANWEALPISLNVYALAIDPVTPSTIYAGTNGSGVYKSTNGGVSWVAVNSRLGNLNVYALAINPATPATIYAGTNGGGVYKSTNGGSSWSSVKKGLSNSNVFALAINPTAPATIYAGTNGGGVFKTTNSGSSWTAVNTGLTTNRVMALAIDPVAPATIYAATNGGGVFKTTNSGTGWAAARTGITTLSVYSLAIDPTTPATIYCGTNGGGIFKSSTSGSSWSATNTGLTSLSVYALAIDRTQTSTIYAGTLRGGICKSLDSGSSWADANSGMNNFRSYAAAVTPTAPRTTYAGAYGGVFANISGAGGWTLNNSGLTSTDIRTLVADPTAPAKIYAGAYGGGLFKSSDGGSSWSVSNSGLTNLNLNALAIPPGTPTTLYATTYGGGFYKSSNSGNSWSQSNSGLTNTNLYCIAIDPLTPATIYVGSNNGGVYKSVNSGTSWVNIRTGMTNRVVNSLAIDPLVPTTLYAGTNGGIFKSIDSGSNWVVMNSGLTTLAVYSVAVDPTDPNVIYAGTNGGGVFRSANAGATWTAFSDGLDHNVIRALYFDPANPRDLYAGTLGAGLYQFTAAPELTVTPMALDYVTVTITTSLAQEITLANPGYAPLAVTPAATFSGADGAMFSFAPGGATPCSSTTPTIPVGGSCTMSVTFTPTAPGARSATLAITSDAYSQPLAEIALSGTAVLPTYALTLTSGGSGSGSVSFAPGIPCSNSCSQSFDMGTVVTLTALPAVNSDFTGWSGCDSVNGSSCTINMTTPKSVSASFSIKMFGLTATVVSGSGTITPATTSLVYGSPQSFTVTAATGSHLVTLNDNGVDVTAAVSAGIYTIASVTAPHALTAFFAPDIHPLTVTGTGTGSGTINISAGNTLLPSPGNITLPLDYGTVVNITAVPAAGAMFDGWSGACSGNATCSLTIDQAKSVTASFLAPAAAPSMIWARGETLAATNPVIWGGSATVNATYELEEATDATFTTNLRQVYVGPLLTAEVTMPATGSYYYRVRAIAPGYLPSPWQVSNASLFQYKSISPSSLWVRAVTSYAENPVVWGASSTPGAVYEVEEIVASAIGETRRLVYSGPDLQTNLVYAASGTFSYRVRTISPGYWPSDWVYSQQCVVNLITGMPASIWARSSTIVATNPVIWGASATPGAIYVVEEAIDPSFTRNRRQVYSGPDLRTDISVNSNGIYYYRVRATSPGYLPSAWNVTVPSTVDLSARSGTLPPASLWVRSATVLSTNPVIWTASPTAGVIYELEESTDPTFTSDNRLLYRGTELSQNVTVLRGGSYYYRVRAIGPDNWPSRWVNSIRSAVQLTCKKPASLWVRTTVNITTNPLIWGASLTPDVHYEVEEAADAAFTTGLRQVYRGPELRSDVTIDSDGVYYYRVRAVKDGYQPSEWMVSLPSSANLAQTIRTLPPASILVRSPSDKDSNLLLWEDISGKDILYEVEMSTEQTFASNRKIIYRGDGQRCYAMTTVEGDYYFRVRAIAPGKLPSLWVNANQLTVAGLSVVKPASLWIRSSTSLDSNPVIWGASTTAGVIYEVEEARDAAFTNGLRQIFQGDGLGTKIAVLEGSGDYYYRVRAVKAGYLASEWVSAGPMTVANLVTVKPASLWVRTVTDQPLIPLVWGASITAGASYEVEESTDPLFASGVRQVYQGTSLRFDVSVASSGTYYYRVRALRGGYLPSDWVNSLASVVTLP